MSFTICFGGWSGVIIGGGLAGADTGGGDFVLVAPPGGRMEGKNPMGKNVGTNSISDNL